MSFVLRDYQRAALTALETDWSIGLLRLGVSAATGTGKTVIMAHLAHAYQSGRVLILVHREELLQQTVDKLRTVDPHLSIGRVKAGLNEIGARIVIASVSTVSRPRRLAQLGQFGLIIVDEAHRSMAASYQAVFGAYPEIRIAGFSATWTRADNKGLGDFWQKISFEYGIGDAVANGDLVRPRGIYIETDFDLDAVKVTAGEYNDRSVGQQLDDESIMKAIIAGWTDHAADRQGVIFAPTVASGELFREGFTAAGYPTEGLYGVTKDADAVHRRFRAGTTQLLVSCTRLAEGWDAPWCSAGIIARPTLHIGTFVQMVGRLLRLCPLCHAPCEHKADALILDPMGSLYRHDLNGVIDLSLSPPPREKDDDDELDPDAEDDELDEPAPAERFRRAGRVVGYEEVDLLFGATEVNWLRTTGGIPFSRLTSGCVVFLVPSSNPEWVRVGQYVGTVAHGGWISDWLPTDAALELVHREYARQARPARWRDGPATKDQIRDARKYGVDLAGRLCRGSVQDVLDIAVASTQLDRVLWTQVDTS